MGDPEHCAQEMEAMDLRGVHAIPVANRDAPLIRSPVHDETIFLEGYRATVHFRPQGHVLAGVEIDLEAHEYFALSGLT